MVIFNLQYLKNEFLEPTNRETHFCGKKCKRETQMRVVRYFNESGIVLVDKWYSYFLVCEECNTEYFLGSTKE